MIESMVTLAKSILRLNNHTFNLERSVPKLVPVMMMVPLRTGEALKGVTVAMVGILSS